jgi:N-acetylmuramoyl-L-alanine amidase
VAPATTPVRAPVIVLDPGHNGGNAAHPEVINRPVPDGAGGTKPCSTTGTATNAGYPEHAFAWDVAMRVRAKLAAAGVGVVLTRLDDSGVGPCVDARGRLAGRVGAAAFLSIHGDGAAAGHRGFHVITSSLDPAGPAVDDGSRRLAATVRDMLAAALLTFLGR